MRRLSPMAARTAAAELGLPRGRRALSGALHTYAQACATELAKRRLPSASLVPRPDSPLTASSDERVVPRTSSPQTGHHEPKIPTKKTARRNHHQDQGETTNTRGEHELPKIDPLSTRPPNPENTHLASCAPLYSSWLLAPPSFELLWEASRKGAFLSSNASLLPVYRSAPLQAPAGSFEKGGVTHFQRLTHMNRPMTNDLPFAARGKNRRENPRTIGIPSCFSLAFSESLVPFLL